MPSADPGRRFLDIIENIQRIHRYTAGMDRSGYLASEITQDAVERCLERISEAAAKLGEAAADFAPSIRWEGIRGLGNVLRHEYDQVDAITIWGIVQNNLPPLLAAAEGALRMLTRNDQP